jgi:hypothetical protein
MGNRVEAINAEKKRPISSIALIDYFYSAVSYFWFYLNHSTSVMKDTLLPLRRVTQFIRLSAFRRQKFR